MRVCVGWYVWQLCQLCQLRQSCGGLANVATTAACLKRKVDDANQKFDWPRLTDLRTYGLTDMQTAGTHQVAVGFDPCPTGWDC